MHFSHHGLIDDIRIYFTFLLLLSGSGDFPSCRRLCINISDTDLIALCLIFLLPLGHFSTIRGPSLIRIGQLVTPYALFYRASRSIKAFQNCKASLLLLGRLVTCLHWLLFTINISFLFLIEVDNFKQFPAIVTLSILWIICCPIVSIDHLWIF